MAPEHILQYSAGIKTSLLFYAALLKMHLLMHSFFFFLFLQVFLRDFQGVTRVWVQVEGVIICVSDKENKGGSETHFEGILGRRRAENLNEEEHHDRRLFFAILRFLAFLIIFRGTRRF